MSPPIRISDEEVEELFSPAAALQSCHEAFRRYGRGEIQNPTREESIRREGHLDLFRLVMPAEWAGRYAGRKLIEERSDVRSGRLGHRSATFELEDLQTGRKAVIAAEHITNMRTGAAGVLGAQYLACQPIRRVAILGTGRIARALALCADEALEPLVILVTSRTVARRSAFEAEVGPRLNARLETVPSILDCIGDADAVLAAVPTPRPLLHAGDLPANVHLSVLGGDARTWQIDPVLLTGRGVVPDQPDQAERSGDLVALRETGSPMPWIPGPDEGICIIADAALGRLEGYRGSGAVAFFTGLAAQDLLAASYVYEATIG